MTMTEEFHTPDTTTKEQTNEDYGSETKESDEFIVERNNASGVSLKESGIHMKLFL